jgi:hypothetical protein
MFKKLADWIYLKNVSRKKDFYSIVYSGYQYTRLLDEQARAILEIIDKEIMKSFEFGLKLSREHVLKEKVVFLYILNEMGSLRLIPKRWEFEEAMKIFGEFMYKAMKDEVDFYFEKLNKKKRATRTMYNCHLEEARSSIFRAIYNHQIPFT